MGQYYVCANIDKKQKFKFDGAKLMEFAYTHNRTMRALMGLMAGIWKGNRVYIVGDYADETVGHEGDEAWVPTLTKTLEELGIKGATEKSGDKEYPVTLYGHIHDTFADIPNMRVDDLAYEGSRFRYILNPELGVYIDLEHCPIEGVYYYADEVRIERVHPLALLLAMGNDRGGGDYHFNHDNFVDLHPERHTKRTNNFSVGSWVETAQHICFARAFDVDALKGLQEWKPGFTEEEKPITPEELPAKAAEAIAKKQ